MPVPVVVCLRVRASDGKDSEAVEQLKAISGCPEEATTVALDIRTKLGELELQHRASAQHQHWHDPKPSNFTGKPKPLTGRSCRPGWVFFGPSFLG